MEPKATVPPESTEMMDCLFPTVSPYAAAPETINPISYYHGNN